MLDDLFTRGGPVLFLLFLLTFLIFIILVNKYSFLYFDRDLWLKEKFKNFVKENPPSSFTLKHVDNTFIAELKRISNENIKLLDGLIGMCPMIGLLGTVYGMIEVFEVLSFLGTGNPRAMSSGVAKATIPTMASMVITLFGLYFRQDLSYRIDKYIKETTLLFKKEGIRIEKKNRRQSEDGNLDLTPMMDIVFIMLIFFIVTTSFVKETGVDINRPNAETAERDEKGNILVALTATNEIWIDKRRVDLKAVRANIERLKIEYPEGSVIIQADKESRSGLLVETMDQIRLAGVQNISIAAKNDS